MVCNDCQNSFIPAFNYTGDICPECRDMMDDDARRQHEQEMFDQDEYEREQEREYDDEDDVDELAENEDFERADEYYDGYDDYRYDNDIDFGMYDE